MFTAPPGRAGDSRAVLLLVGFVVVLLGRTEDNGTTLYK